MRVSAIQTYQDIVLPARTQAVNKQAANNRNLGPDTVRISPEAQAKVNELVGSGEPELNGAGKLVADKLKTWLDATKLTGEYEETSEILPLNYARLQAIEAEIARGNDSQELKAKKLVLQLFGDVRELSQKDLDEGAALIMELMPSDNTTLAFEDVVSLLRKTCGMGQSSSYAGDAMEHDKKDEEGASSAENQLVLEELKTFLDESKGASVEISINQSHKTTRVTRGPDEDGLQTIRFNVESSIFTGP